jgi:hypothetical protein
MDINYQRETLSFDEKIALAELEVTKAEERVRELKYQKSRFALDYFLAVVKQQQDQEQGKA